MKLRHYIIFVIFAIITKCIRSEFLEGHNTDDNAELINSTNNIPCNCSLREKFKIQPVHDENSFLLKCCPIGQSLNYDGGTNKEELCHSNDKDYISNIHPIHAILYDNCVEDIEVEVPMEIKVGYPCNTSVLLDKIDDIFYILQDGSLLLMNKYANESFSVIKQYCLDTDDSGIVNAIVCILPATNKQFPIQKILSTFIVLITILSLLLSGYCHIVIKDFRSTGGLCIVAFCIFNALEFLIFISANFFKFDLNVIGCIQKFVIILQLSWFLCLCTEILTNVMKSEYSCLRVNKSFVVKGCSIGIYCIMSFLVAGIISTLGTNKITSILEEGVSAEQHQFIYILQKQMWGVALGFLTICFTLLVVSYIKIKMKQKERSNNISFDFETFEKVKSEATCANFLLLLLTSYWIINIFSLYCSEHKRFLAIIDTFNDFRGFLILIILMWVHQKWIFVFRWWNDRGFYILEKSETSSISN